MKSNAATGRYSAKLLFQFRVATACEHGRFRICEQRIVLIRAPSAKLALVGAKRTGAGSEVSIRM
jgi:hypothetical protein